MSKMSNIVKATHALDLENEILKIMSEEITAELDKVMLDDLVEFDRREKLTPEQRAVEDYELEGNKIIEKLKKAPIKKWQPSSMTVTTQNINAPSRKLTAKWTMEDVKTLMMPPNSTPKKPVKTKKPTK